ncbi:MAG: pilus assembly protein TadG-related protein [Thermodesulfobacteriota bacterium]|nr:pilus assembly protein TadG-related protein [Thermodesulfobacteriota bacterium]
MKNFVQLLKSLVNPVINSSRALNPALRGGTPYGAEPGIILKCNPAAESFDPEALDGQRDIISNGVNQHGTIVIFIALALVMLLGFAALAVDIAHITVTKNELQNISDGASLAATRYLGEIYKDMTYEDQQTYNATGDADDIIAIAKDVGLKNQAGKKNITINDTDVIIGTWNPQTKQVEPNPKTGQWLDQPDAVRVIARRSSGSVEGPISNFFAKVLGKDTTNVEADAVAALTGDLTAGPGGLQVPVGISKYWFNKPPEEFCNQPIKFYPTGTLEGCAGWHAFTEPKVNDKIMREIIAGMEGGTYSSPETIAYMTEFNFSGGTLSEQTFLAFKALFDTMKVKNDGILDSDEVSTTWTTRVAVYNQADCSNPNKEITIVGFATATILAVLDAPEKTILAQVKCNNVEPGRGGGGNYGTKGTIPNLVE